MNLSIDPFKSPTKELRETPNPLKLFPARKDAITKAFFSVDAPKQLRKIENTKRWLESDQLNPEFGIHGDSQEVYVRRTFRRIESSKLFVPPQKEHTSLSELVLPVKTTNKKFVLVEESRLAELTKFENTLRDERARLGEQCTWVLSDFQCDLRVPVPATRLAMQNVCETEMRKFSHEIAILNKTWLEYQKKNHYNKPHLYLQDSYMKNAPIPERTMKLKLLQEAKHTYRKRLDRDSMQFEDDLSYLTDKYLTAQNRRRDYDRYFILATRYGYYSPEEFYKDSHPGRRYFKQATLGALKFQRLWDRYWSITKLRRYRASRLIQKMIRGYLSYQKWHPIIIIRMKIGRRAYYKFCWKLWLDYNRICKKIKEMILQFQSNWRDLCFTKWRDYVKEEMRHKNLIKKRFVMRLMNARLAGIFLSWQNYVEKIKSLKRKMRRHFQMPHFDMWVEYTQWSKKTKQLHRASCSIIMCIRSRALRLKYLKMKQAMIKVKRMAKLIYAKNFVKRKREQIIQSSFLLWLPSEEARLYARGNETERRRLIRLQQTIQEKEKGCILELKKHLRTPKGAKQLEEMYQKGIPKQYAKQYGLTNLKSLHISPSKLKLPSPPLSLQQINQLKAKQNNNNNTNLIKNKNMNQNSFLLHAKSRNSSPSSSRPSSRPTSALYQQPLRRSSAASVISAGMRSRLNSNVKISDISDQPSEQINPQTRTSSRPPSAGSPRANIPSAITEDSSPNDPSVDSFTPSSPPPPPPMSPLTTIESSADPPSPSSVSPSLSNSSPQSVSRKIYSTSPPPPPRMSKQEIAASRSLFNKKNKPSLTKRKPQPRRQPLQPNPTPESSSTDNTNQSTNEKQEQEQGQELEQQSAQKESNPDDTSNPLDPSSSETQQEQQQQQQSLTESQSTIPNPTPNDDNQPDSSSEPVEKNPNHSDQAPVVQFGNCLNLNSVSSWFGRGNQHKIDEGRTRTGTGVGAGIGTGGGLFDRESFNIATMSREEQNRISEKILLSRYCDLVRKLQRHEYNTKFPPFIVCPYPTCRGISTCETQYHNHCEYAEQHRDQPDHQFSHFHLMLKNIKGIEAVRSFILSMFGVGVTLNRLDCWLAIQDWIRTPSTSKGYYSRAESLLDTFLKEGSSRDCELQHDTFPITLSTLITIKMRDFEGFYRPVKSHPTLFRRMLGIEGVTYNEWSDEFILSPEIFYEIEWECFEHLFQLIDSNPLFEESELYQIYLVDLEKHEKDRQEELLTQFKSLRLQNILTWTRDFILQEQLLSLKAYEDSETFVNEEIESMINELMLMAIEEQVFEIRGKEQEIKESQMLVIDDALYWAEDDIVDWVYEYYVRALIEKMYSMPECRKGMLEYAGLMRRKGIMMKKTLLIDNNAKNRGESRDWFKDFFKETLQEEKENLPMEVGVAALKIQRIYRGFQGRKLARRKFISTYTKHFDPSVNMCYYVNGKNGSSSWDKPKMIKYLYPNSSW